MASTRTVSRFQALYKAKKSPWKETLRQRRVERSKTARAARVDALRRPTIQHNELEDDLALEEELRLEQVEREFEMFDAVLLPVTHACPVCCTQMHVHTFGVKTIFCEPCGIKADLSWKEFQEVLEQAHTLHSSSGCVRTAEFLHIEGHLFLACDTCDYLDMTAL